MSAINYGIDIEKLPRAGNSVYAPIGKAYLTIDGKRTSSSKFLMYSSELYASNYNYLPDKTNSYYVAFSSEGNNDVFFDIPVQLGGKSNARRKASAIKTGPRGGKYIIKNGRKCYIK